jgi:hypothetical protein
MATKRRPTGCARQRRYVSLCQGYGCGLRDDALRDRRAGSSPVRVAQGRLCPYAYALDTDADHLAEALDGSRLALRVASRDVLAVVTEISVSVDTFPGDVRYAAGHALWRAVGVDRPALCAVRGGQLVFPDEVF